MKAGFQKGYVGVLVEVGRKGGKLEEIKNAAEAFLEALQKDSDLLRFIMNPVIPRETKVRILSERLSSVLPELFLRFLLVLIRVGLQLELLQILEAIPEEIDRALGRIRVELTSARALDPEEKERLRKAVSKKLGAEVILKERVRKDIIGGFVLRWDTTVLDLSLKGKLSKLGAFLKEEVVLKRKMKFG